MVSVAYAQATGAQSGMSEMLFFPLILVAIMYFLMIRPQMKRTKETKAMLDALQKGDEVVAAGMLGKVIKVGDAYIGLEIADNVVVQVQKQAVATVLPKGSIKNPN
jgi:preprotein translocase subunit YajC